MDKLRVCRMLLLLATSISLTAQRPAPQLPSDLHDPSSWIADHDHRPSARGYGLLDDVGDVVWTYAAQRQQRKRGFSMLTRWKPFNALSKQRTSIRNINRAPYDAADDFETVSAETRALSRPSGQPLRWG